MALKPENPVVGGNVLRRQAIESPNYVPGVSGWTIKQDGSAEFNNLTLRGTFNGTNYVINSAGAFFYSPSEAAGNLINSITNSSGTDPFGNNYLTGSASYGGNQATTSVNGVLFFYTGSLAGGWVQQGSIQADTSNAGQIDVQGAEQVSGNLIVQGTTITGSSVTSVSVPSATIDVHNGNVNLNMARPPNYAAVVAGTATAAQVEACLGGLLTSLTNRQLMA